MSTESRPLVFVHGLWNDPSLFVELRKLLPESERPILAPNLEHEFGRIPLRSLAVKLDDEICRHYGSDRPIDLVCFSMGGIVARIWLQEMGGAYRTKKFITIGTPHHGTFLAQLMPRFLFAGVADMKRGSALLGQLNQDITLLESLSCSSFFTPWDLMVFPGWEAILPCGRRQALPAKTHRGLITNPKALSFLVDMITS